VNKSQDLGVREGVEYERRVFHGLFGSKDQKIGMSRTDSQMYSTDSVKRHDCLC
jgi:hypothetical protein